MKFKRFLYYFQVGHYSFWVWKFLGEGVPFSTVSILPLIEVTLRGWVDLNYQGNEASSVISGDVCERWDES